MAIVTATNFRLKPGGLEVFRKDVGQAKAALERCGAKKVRVLAAIVGGEATTSLAISWEADNYESYGKVIDKYQADPEGAAQVLAFSSPYSATDSIQSTVWQEINL
jgi:hypothetical protein